MVKRFSGIVESVTQPHYEGEDVVNIVASKGFRRKIILNTGLLKNTCLLKPGTEVEIIASAHDMEKPRSTTALGLFSLTCIDNCKFAKMRIAEGGGCKAYYRS